MAPPIIIYFAHGSARIVLEPTLNYAVTIGCSGNQPAISSSISLQHQLLTIRLLCPARQPAPQIKMDKRQQHTKKMLTSVMKSS